MPLCICEIEKTQYADSERLQRKWYNVWRQMKGLPCFQCENKAKRPENISKGRNALAMNETETRQSLNGQNTDELSRQDPSTMTGLPSPEPGEEGLEEFDEMNCEHLSHDELWALAQDDVIAMAAFYYRYQYDDDPVIRAEVREVLKSLAENVETGFWPLEWYAELRDSEDPEEQKEAELWKRKILEEDCCDRELLSHYGLTDGDAGE